MSRLHALYFWGTADDEAAWMHDAEGRVYVFTSADSADMYRKYLLSNFEQISVRPYFPEPMEWTSTVLQDALNRGRRIRESA